MIPSTYINPWVMLHHVHIYRISYRAKLPMNIEQMLASEDGDHYLKRSHPNILLDVLFFFMFRSF